MYNPDVHHRKSIRIKEYDYSKNGMYFITICTQNRKCILSEIIGETSSNVVGAGLVPARVSQNPEMAMSDIVGAHDCAQPKLILSHIGRITQKELINTEKINENITIDEYIIMPNHIHMIINIDEDKQGAQSCAPTKKKAIGNIIRGIKSAISKQIGYSIWQRNYYEHIIRNEKELYKIIEYIQYNPINWTSDPNYMP
jgi:REP element-mobilizing transposase RayT